MVVTLSVAVLYVATKCIDQFIKEEGYGRLKSFLFSKGKYINLLRELIMTVIDDFAKTDQNNYSGKIPFYHSPEVFQALMDHVLFKEVELKEVIHLLEANQNVLQPDAVQVKRFFELFYAKVKTDSKLKKMFIEENYQAEIFNISGTIKKIDAQLTRVSKEVKDIKSAIVNINNNTATDGRPVITANYVSSPEESELIESLVEKHVLLLTGVSFCGKSQLAKTIAEGFLIQGYKYASSNQAAEANRFLRNPIGKHIFLLEDPFGHTLEADSHKTLRQIEELIRNLAPGNKLIVTTRTEVLLGAMAANNLLQCTIEGLSWSELTKRNRIFLTQAWQAMSADLPYQCQILIENHLNNDDHVMLLQIGQLAHLSRLPVESLIDKPLEILLHVAKADSRTLSLEIKNRSRGSAHLYTILGLAVSTTQGIKVEDLAYILADNTKYPGLLKREALRVYDSRSADEVSFPKYDQDYKLSEQDKKELGFFVERGYLEIANSQVYFKHPTYQEAARYLLLETSVLEVEYILKKLKRTMSCLSRNATYLARQLSFIYKGVYQADLKSGILKLIYKLAGKSIFPSVEDLLLKFLLEALPDMDQKKQEGTFQLIDLDKSSSDIFWEDDQPFYTTFERDFFDEDAYNKIEAKQFLKEIVTGREMTALQQWSIVRLISDHEFDIREFPNVQTIDQLLNAEETFIRSTLAYTILNKLPSAEDVVLDRIFGDTNPWVVVEAIRGAIFGYANYRAKQRERILPLLLKSIRNGFVIARIKTLLTCFAQDYGSDHIDWEEISPPESQEMWELWGMLFPAFMENMPITVSIYNSGRFGQTMNASIKFLKNTPSGLKVATAFYRWVDARIKNGLTPDTYELGIISYLLKITDDTIARLPLFEKIFKYPKSNLVLYSLSWAISDWDQLSHQERQIILNLCGSNRKDKRWIIATVITQYQLPCEIQQLLFGDAQFFSQSAVEILKVIPPEMLKDAIAVYTGDSYLFEQVGISYSRSEKWHEILKEILISGHENGLQLCIQKFIINVINGPTAEWADDYIEIWEQMCNKEDLKTQLIEQLVLGTAISNPSIPPCKNLWLKLIEVHPGAQKGELAAKVALAIEAIQSHDPNDIFEFFDNEFFNMIVSHCPLDALILSTLLQYKDANNVLPQTVEKFINDVTEQAKTANLRLEITFQYIKNIKHSEFEMLRLIPNKIDEAAKKWFKAKRLEPKILNWM